MKPGQRRKKLIEVALPLDIINEAGAREKTIRHGHPSSLHLWWARRPLAVARAIIFAQMVDDPSSNPGAFPTVESQNVERERLFKLIAALVDWDNNTSSAVLEAAHIEMVKSYRSSNGKAEEPGAFDLPAFYDPFSGGGALPLEAQRLGLQAYASDLNPVAVLITRALIEIPVTFACSAPVSHKTGEPGKLVAQTWAGAQGMAEDVRHYGGWILDEARKQIGCLYPAIRVTAARAKAQPELESFVGQNLNVIAWLWARTVKSPDPAFSQADVPLISSFMLSSKVGKNVYLRPVIRGHSYELNVVAGAPEDRATAESGTKLGRGANFRCILSGAPITPSYIKEQSTLHRMGAKLTAIVAEGPRGRIYLSAAAEDEELARSAAPEWTPDIEISGSTQYVGVKPYGISKFAEIFTARQLVALNTFADLIQKVRGIIEKEAISTGMEPGEGLRSGGDGAVAYADAITTYLAFALSKQADLANSLCRWEPIAQCPRQLFGRQAIPLVWDFAEGNPLGRSSGSWSILVDGIANALGKAFVWAGSYPRGTATQADSATQEIGSGKVISTDPPYYDNVPYADLSDFFYIWLRRCLKNVYPNLFATVAVPKNDELVAFAYRHGGKEQANAFFLKGMIASLRRLADQSHPDYPVTIYYAFKQSETDESGTVSTGWETFLDAVIQAGFSLTGTWPVRTENSSRMRGQGANALASSIVLACRPKDPSSPVATRRDFIRTLKEELPSALSYLQRGNIAPVDLAQSAIGPGMAIYTRFQKVLDAQGGAVSIRDALTLINEIVDEVLAQQEGDFDAATRWAVAWFEQFGFNGGEYGVAETLSKAKNMTVSSLVSSGIVESRGGRVRLIEPTELAAAWQAQDGRGSIWEIVHHLIRQLESGGESGAAALMATMDSRIDAARALPYRLYTICERKKWAREALVYNDLVQSWPEICALAQQRREVTANVEPTLFAPELGHA